MKPIDFRNATFERLKGKLAGRLQEVYCAWMAHGPGTTRQLAHRSGIDILNLRPRTTDLVDCGLVEVCGAEGSEGIYRARAQADWEEWAAAMRAGKVESQAQLI